MIEEIIIRFLFFLNSYFYFENLYYYSFVTFFPKIPSRMAFTKERTTPKINAHKKLSKTKPGTIPATSMIRSVFRTRRNNPNVTMVTGSVSNTKTGRISPFIAPRTSAIISAVIKPATCTPCKKYAEIMIAIAEIIQWVSILIIIFLIYK